MSAMAQTGYGCMIATSLLSRHCCWPTCNSGVRTFGQPGWPSGPDACRHAPVIQPTILSKSWHGVCDKRGLALSSSGLDIGLEHLSRINDSPMVDPNNSQSNISVAFILLHEPFQCPKVHVGTAILDHLIIGYSAGPSSTPQR